MIQKIEELFGVNLSIQFKANNNSKYPFHSSSNHRDYLTLGIEIPQSNDVILFLTG